jgi:hypothetical protein
MWQVERDEIPRHLARLHCRLLEKLREGAITTFFLSASNFKAMRVRDARPGWRKLPRRLFSGLLDL